MAKAFYTVLLSALLLTGCGGGINSSYDGDAAFVLHDASTNNVLTSTQSAPYQTNGNFTVLVYEGHYTGAFTGTITTENSSCYTIAPAPGLEAPAFTMTAKPTVTNNPCTPGATYGITFADANGHSTVLWFELNGTVVLPSSSATRSLTTP
jgi:hypothetical protein